MIFEVASVSCGGDSSLANAVQRKQVVKMGPPGNEMYYFPKKTVGTAKEWETTERMSRNQERSAAEFSDYAASIDTFMPTFNATDPMLALLHHNAPSASSGEAPQADMASLKDKSSKLAMAVTVAEKIIEKIKNLGPAVPERLQLAGCTVMSLAEGAELLRGEANFMIKFNKDSKGNAATGASIATYCSRLDQNMNKIVEEVRVIKSLSPQTLANKA